MTFECLECGWTEEGQFQPSNCPSCGGRMEVAEVTLQESMTRTKEGKPCRP